MSDQKENAIRYQIDDDEISLKDVVQKIREWIKFLLSKSSIILIAAVIGGALGFLKAYFDETTYTAELTFVLESGSGNSPVGAYAGLASQFGLDMGGGSQGVFEGENLFALMKSRLMIEKTLLTTVKRNNSNITLAEYYISISGLREKWIDKDSPLKDVKFSEGEDPSQFSLLQNSAINSIHRTIIAENLAVDKKDKKSGIVSLRVVSPDELFSKLFVEVLSKEVSTFYVETKTKRSSDNVRILQSQTDSIKRELSRSLAGAASSIDANPNPNLARMILRVPSQRRQGDVQMNQAILAQLVQNLEIAKMSLRTETPLIQVIDRPVLPLAKSKANSFRAFIIWAIMSSVLFSVFLIIRRILNSL